MSEQKTVIVKYDPNAELIGWIFRMVIIFVMFWQTSVEFPKGHYLQSFAYAIFGLLFASPEIKKVIKLLMTIVKTVKK